jgi:membrane protease YdiL (CAAX protease family)
LDEQTWQDASATPVISVQDVPNSRYDTPPIRAHSVKRNTVQDTWGWLWKDTLGRVAPFVAATAIYAKASGSGARGVGWTSEGWRQDILFGVAAGIPLAGIAAIYRSRVASGYRLPTPPDQILQTTFYLAVNAPAEELFWRGMVQTLTISGLRRIRLHERTASMLGWALATAAFGAYHRLGNWSWQAIGGVTAAGGLFGAIYLATGRRRSLLLPTILHGFMTAGFLSWGDVWLHRLATLKQQAEVTKSIGPKPCASTSASGGASSGG